MYLHTKMLRQIQELLQSAQFPFLPERFTGSRMAQELDYLIQDLADHDPTLCSVTDFLCYLQRSLSLFRPQFPIRKMQVTALPWRVTCCQVLKKWWWRGQTDWSPRQNYINLYLQQDLHWEKILFAILVKLQPPSSTHNIAKAVQRLATPQKRSCISLLHLPQISTRTCTTFFFFFSLLS